MTEVVALFCEGDIGRPPVKLQAPGRNPDEACDHPQQGGFSCTIAAGHDHRLPGRQTETQVAEYLPPAASAGQPIGFKAHHGYRGPFAGARKAASGPENPDILSISGKVPRSIWRRARKALISPNLRRYVIRNRTQVSPTRKTSPCQ